MRIGTVERAFELAQSGRCHNMQDLEKALKKEGCDNVQAHLSGAGLRRDLNARIRAARQPKPA